MDNYTHSVEVVQDSYVLVIGMVFCYFLYGLAIVIGIPLNLLVIYRMIRLSTKLTDFYK